MRFLLFQLKDMTIGFMLPTEMIDKARCCSADQNGLPSEFAEEQQHQEPVQTQTYKEGLAQSKAAKGPALQVQGPSATRSFADLGVCKSLSDHLAGQTFILIVLAAVAATSKMVAQVLITSSIWYGGKDTG